MTRRPERDAIDRFTNGGDEPPDDCAHVWDGPQVEIDGGFSATCSRCGMTAFAWSLSRGW